MSQFQGRESFREAIQPIARHWFEGLIDKYEGLPAPVIPAANGQPEDIGACGCGGRIVQVRAPITVEVGGQPVTQTTEEVHCTGCGEEWMVRR